MASEYQRLPGKSRSFLGKSTLWLADDHILTVQSHRFSEDYTRFYLADIQALIVRERQGLGVPLEMIIAIGLILFVVATFINWWLAVLSLPAVALYLRHRARGPMCDCHVITATGTWPLPALTRIKAARQCFDRLRPLIEQKQGVMDVSAALEQGAAVHLGPPARDARRSNGGYAILFLLALFSGGVSTWATRRPTLNDPGLTAAILLTLALIGAALITLIRSRASATPTLRYAALTILGFKLLKGGALAIPWVVLLSGATQGRVDLDRARTFANTQALPYCFEGLIALTAIVGLLTMIEKRRPA